MIQPNRLRDQVLSSNIEAATAPRAATAPGAPRWSRRRALLVTSVADVLLLLGSMIVAISAPATMPAILAFDGLALLTLGATVTSRAGGGRAIWFVLEGLAVGSLVGGVFGTMANGYAGTTWVNTVLSYAAIGVILQAVPAGVGAAISAAWAAVRAQRRHRTVASGEAALVKPAGPLERRSDDDRPLDAISAAKLAEDGAATRIVRVYHRLDPGQLLQADVEGLAAMGYRLTSVERRRPWPAIVWVPLGIVVFMLLFAVMFSEVTSAASLVRVWSDARRGRCVAGFDLVSPDHRPVPVAPIAGAERLIRGPGGGAPRRARRRRLRRGSSGSRQ